MWLSAKTTTTFHPETLRRKSEKRKGHVCPDLIPGILCIILRRKIRIDVRSGNQLCRYLSLFQKHSTNRLLTALLMRDTFTTFTSHKGFFCDCCHRVGITKFSNQFPHNWASAMSQTTTAIDLATQVTESLFVELLNRAFSLSLHNGSNH